MLLSYALCTDSQTKQMANKTANLNANIDQEIFRQHPEVIENSNEKGYPLVCKL